MTSTPPTRPHARRFRQGAARLSRRPALAVPAAAAAGSAVLVALAGGGRDGFVLAAAGAAAAAAFMIRWLERFRAGEGIRDTATALDVVHAILSDLHPGPEPVTAADPETLVIDWDPACPQYEDEALPGHRADKMLVITAAVRVRAAQDGVLHRLPQLLLVGGDGAVVELFGRNGQGRTGRLGQDIT